jgi:MFS family permease
MTDVADRVDGRATEPSTGELVSEASRQVSKLVREELQLAQIEITAKAKKAGMGLGMFGASGVLALYGGGVLLAAGVLALALVVPGWLAALIVGGALMVVAGMTALVGKSRVAAAAPPVPERTVQSVKREVEAVRHPQAQRSH